MDVGSIGNTEQMLVNNFITIITNIIIIILVIIFVS